MPDDELTYSEITDIAARKAALSDLYIESTEQDQTLFIQIRRRHPCDEVSSRAEVMFWTSGTGAFLVDFDDRWSLHVMAYGRTDQVEAIDEIVKVAECYLRGDGEERTTRHKWRAVERILVIAVGDESVFLQTKHRKPRRP